MLGLNFSNFDKTQENEINLGLYELRLNISFAIFRMNKT